jgi:hypothetical protein
MNFKVSISTLLLSIAFTASADMRVISQAYEVSLEDLRMPRNFAGMIEFKECESCDYVMKRVNANTQYQLNGRSISLDKFRFAIGKVEDRKAPTVTVLHHLESDRVTMIAVNL